MGFIVGKVQATPVEKKQRGKAEYVTVATETPVLDDTEVTNDTDNGDKPADAEKVVKKVGRPSKGGRK